MSTAVHDSKLVSETITIRMDMLSRLIPGETVQTCDTTVETFTGEDDDPTAILSGDPTVSGSQIRQQITGGVEGVIYKVSFAARTSDNNILINQCLVAVLPSPEVTVPELS